MRLDSRGPRRPSRREFLVGTAAIASATLLLDATEIDRHRLVVETQTIRMAKLPSAFHGFRIVQISDFHYTHYVEAWFLREVVRRVNALGPDMVCMTGDFITSDQYVLSYNRRHAVAVAEILGDLTCPLRFCSLGNHDSVDFDGVSRALEHRGLAVLRNQYTTVERGGERLCVGGLADAYFDAPDLPRSIPAKRADTPMILLGHEPDIAPMVSDFGGVDLFLTGHTHGGQVRLPFLPPMFLPDMGRHYLEGVYRVGAMHLYVTRGIGTVHLPIRFRCPPEITVLTLQPA